MDRDSFMKVWQRVRPDAAAEGAGDSPAAALRAPETPLTRREALGELIAEREALTKLYARLRREGGGTCAALAREGERFGALSLPALRAELFLRGADCPAAQDIRAPGVLSALRELCARETAWGESCLGCAAAAPAARRAWLTELSGRAGELADRARALLSLALR